MDINYQFDKNAHLDKLKLLYHQSYPAVFFSMIVALILAAIFWHEASKTNLLVWLSFIFLSSAFRLVLFFRYHRISPQGVAILKWEKSYFYTLIFSAAVWGLGVVLISYQLPFLYQSIAYSFLLGLAGAALSVYSAIRCYAITAIVIVLLPMILWLLIQGGVIPVMLSAAAATFLLSALRATNVLSTTLHKSFALAYELREAKEKAEHLASTDMLTELNNRRAFMALANIQIEYCKRHDHPVSMMVLDIDHFKKINDAYGHAAGDMVLQAFAKILKKSVRSSDICGRLGGEEFAILLSNTEIDEALVVAEKLLDIISRHAFYTAGDNYSITTSIGVSTGHYDLESLLNMADNAMYEAKKAGRNQIVSQPL